MSDIDSDTKPKIPPTDSGFTAAYASFQTVIRHIEQMAEEGGAPSRIDRSYLTKLPGGAQTVFVASCKSLGLIDDESRPTKSLEALVAASPDERKGLIADLMRDKYPGPMALGNRAVQSELEEEFRKLNVSGSTLRKAVGFYLNALKYAGVSYSSNFKLPKVGSSGSRPKRKSADSKPPAGDDEDDPQLPAAGGREDLPTLVQGLIEKLPAEGAQWTAGEAKQWLDIAKLTFPFVYGYKDGGPDS